MFCYQYITSTFPYILSHAVTSLLSGSSLTWHIQLLHGANLYSIETSETHTLLIDSWSTQYRHALPCSSEFELQEISALLNLEDDAFVLVTPSTMANDGLGNALLSLTLLLSLLSLSRSPRRYSSLITAGRTRRSYMVMRIAETRIVLTKLKILEIIVLYVEVPTRYNSYKILLCFVRWCRLYSRRLGMNDSKIIRAADMFSDALPKRMIDSV